MNLFTSTWGNIYTGSIREGLAGLVSSSQPSTIMMVADEHTSVLCAPLVHAVVGPTPVVMIPAGEKNKTLQSCEQIWNTLIEADADRSSLVLNVGGGVICDMGGFAASCYQRGIRFAQIPTSLLAMADAAIGGKTGVDFKGYKNYIGRIEPPAFIWIDPVFLQTLPEIEIRNGLTEIVKHAIIRSPALWETLENTEISASLPWIDLLEENIIVKKRVIEEDPFENGLRKILNFGHTIGHALESHFLESPHPLSHGEAVTLGMMAEARMALKTGLLGEEDFNRIINLIRRLLRPIEVPLPGMEEMRIWLAGDKKKSYGRVMYSLPEKIGSCKWNIPVDEMIVIEALDWLATHGRPPVIRLSHA